MSDTALRLAEQALAAHRRRLITATNKDEVRRAIKATQGRIKELKSQHHD